MFDGIGKAFLWLLAIVGGVVVVRKYVPGLYSSSASSSNQLPAASGTPALTVAKGVRVVPCSAGGRPGIDPLQRGMQSSPLYRWCYLVQAGDSAGLIAERIAGDSARYVEILVANPMIAKKGTMGTVLGADAWDFAEGSLSNGTKILVPQTMNAWIDQFGNTTGGYLPWPPDPRSIVEVDEILKPLPDTEKKKTGIDTTIDTLAKGVDRDPSTMPGFDYEGEAVA